MPVFPVGTEQVIAGLTCFGFGAFCKFFQSRTSKGVMAIKDTPTSSIPELYMELAQRPKSEASPSKYVEIVGDTWCKKPVMSVDGINRVAAKYEKKYRIEQFPQKVVYDRFGKKNVREGKRVETPCGEKRLSSSPLFVRMPASLEHLWEEDYIRPLKYQTKLMERKGRPYAEIKRVKEQLWSIQRVQTKVRVSPEAIKKGYLEKDKGYEYTHPPLSGVLNSQPIVKIVNVNSALTEAGIGEQLARGEQEQVPPAPTFLGEKVHTHEIELDEKVYALGRVSLDRARNELVLSPDPKRPFFLRRGSEYEILKQERNSLLWLDWGGNAFFGVGALFLGVGAFRMAKSRSQNDSTGS